MEKASFIRPGENDPEHYHGAEEGVPVNNRLFPIVAIGVSGGGPEALARFFRALPSSPGMAYVIIQHVAVQQDAILPEWMEKDTEMKVCVAEEGRQLEKDQVFIIPPGASLSIAHDKFILFPHLRTEGGFHSVDFFLTELASAFGEKAIAIILSGIIADGAAGIRAIRAAGGITFAQDDTARFTGMPHYATAAGDVDFILPPEGIAAELTALKEFMAAYGDGRYMAVSGDGRQEIPVKDRLQLDRIYGLIRERCDLDLSLYKWGTVSGRIFRRMMVNRIHDLESYVSHLADDAREAELLHKDLLLDQAGFFREPFVYQSLAARLLPALMHHRLPDDPIRIWIPSCNTGEEAYSVAICLLEYRENKGITLPVRIFATDWNEFAIARARRGIFDKSTLENVSQRRLNKFFTKMEGGYQVNKEVRELFVFAVLDPVLDAAFSRIDIVCCRNRIINLGDSAPPKVLKSFHYALKQSGYLVLTDPEPTELLSEYFAPLGEDGRMYTRRATPPSRPAAVSMTTERTADSVLLSRYVPASILIGRDLRILRFYGDVTPYFRPTPGKASLSLMRVIRDELIFEVKGLLEKARRYRQAVKRTGISISRDNEQTYEVTLEVIPVKSLDGMHDLWLIVIRESTLLPAAGESSSTAKRPTMFKELEKDLRDARQQILAINEALETVCEEFQVTRQELLSSNEELQSVNEELDASNIELQSANRDLTAVGNEWRLKGSEWKEAAEYAFAILDAIRIPLLVLNTDGKIYMGNRAFYDAFHLDPRALQGRGLFDIANGLFDIAVLRQPWPALLSAKDNYREMEGTVALGNRTERSILFGVTRIRTEADRPARILLCMEDITDRKLAERKKDEFIGIASHELKTPATSIQAYTQILYQEFLEAKDQRSAFLVSKLNNQVARLTRLTKDLLDVTKITEGQLRLKKTWFDPAALIIEVMEEVQRTTAHRIVIKKASPLPSIWADRERIEQVLVNLLSNAIKYSPPEEEVHISAGITNEGISFSVQDFGIGIPDDIKDKIFDRFFRSNDPSASKHPGLGLGLYISYEIVRQHGGRITIRDGQDRGSVFAVTVPLPPSAG
jgi:two-component system CheB/CheR fusion protein